MGITRAHVRFICVLIFLCGGTVPVFGQGMTLSVEALYLTRNVKNLPTSVRNYRGYEYDETRGVQDEMPGTVLLETDDVEPGWAPGYRAMLQLPAGENGYFEIGGMYIRHSERENGEKSSMYDPDPYDPYMDPIMPYYPNGYETTVRNGGFVDVEGLQGSQQHTLSYVTKLGGVEANYVRKFGPCFGVLVGVRYMELRERLRLFSLDDEAYEDEPDWTGSLKVKTRNQMLGLQAGGLCTVPLVGDLYLDGNAKAGLYMNWKSKDISYYANYEDVCYDNDESSRQLATALEGAAALRWQINEAMALRIGYMGMYLSGVATAPNNFPKENTEAEWNQLDDGSAFYHGGFAGLSYTF